MQSGFCEYSIFDSRLVRFGAGQVIFYRMYADITNRTSQTKEDMVWHLQSMQIWQTT